MKKKIESLRFHMFEIPQLCEHFQAMAKQGWMLEEYIGGSALYKKEEPQDATFIIHIASDYYVFSLGDKPSSKDQEFVAFAQEYGFEHVCSHSAYQIYKSKDTQGISFYSPSFEAYLKDYKPHVIKYEFWRSILPAFGMLCLCFILPFKNPPFSSLLDNQGVISFYILPYLIWLFPLMLLYPIVHKMIAKEKYQTDFASIQLRSNFITNVMLMFALPYVLSPFPSISIVLYLISIFVFTRTILQYVFRKLTRNALKISIMMLLFVLIGFVLCSCLLFPYRNETQMFPREIAIHDTQSSIFATTYDVTRQDDPNRYTLTIIQNHYVEPEFLKLIQKDGIKSEIRWNTWNSYLMMDGTTYVIKDNKILHIYEEITDVDALEQYLIDFQI